MLSLQEIMAVKFKNYITGLLVVSALSFTNGENVFIEKAWLESYEEVFVNLTRSRSLSPPVWYLSFQTENQDFVFELTNDVFNLFDQQLSVSVNNDFEVPFKRFQNDPTANILTGHMQTECCSFFAIVKIINHDLDAVIKTENETIYIESCNSFSKEVCLDDMNVNIPLTNETKLFHNVLYRPNDINLHKLNASSIDFGGIVFEGNNDKNGTRRTKRASTSGTDCTIHIVADHTFYQATGHSSLANTIMEMSYLVLEANLIFRGTDFDGNGAGDNIGFHVSKITVFTNSSYYMATAPDAGAYLDLLTEYDFSAFCMGTAFTSRDFDSGIIGLAWVADSNPFGPSGGICQKRIKYNSKYISLNTNIVTNVNAGQRMPKYVTALTYAHEMGHSFGSPHDSFDNSDCVPNDHYGNYLMFPYASQGELPNNNIFSSCSINYIYPVLRNKAGCFTDSKQSVCGNGIIEDGEECDCGSGATCSGLDKCCTPSDVSGMDADAPCTFRRSNGSQCSPRMSLCCSEECRITAANANKVCQVGSDCTTSSYCDGILAECPASQAVPDTTPCAQNTKSCLDGVCDGSVCATIGLNSCSCTGDLSCFTCCTNSSVCTPYLNNLQQKQALMVGISCQGNFGFCDGKGHCIALDHAGTLNRLSHVFTNEQAENFVHWLRDHWYYVALGLVTIIFLVVVFVKTCRGDENVQTEAYMAGRYSRIVAEAEIQKHYLQQRRDKLEAKYMKKIQQIKNNCLPMDFPTAIARMMVFFPTTPMDIIISTLRQSVNEEAAVRMLILRRYPFRRVEKAPYVPNDADGTMID